MEGGVECRGLDATPAEEGVPCAPLDARDGLLVVSAREFFDWVLKNALKVRGYENRIVGEVLYNDYGPVDMRGDGTRSLLGRVCIDEVADAIWACELGEQVIARLPGAFEEGLLRLRYLQCCDVATTARVLGSTRGTIENVQRRVFARIDRSGMLGRLELRGLSDSLRK